MDIDVNKKWYTREEERLNLLTHLIGAVLGVIGLILILIKFKGAEPMVLFAMLVFIISTIIVYTTSSLYHLCDPAKSLKSKYIYQKIDHCMVALVILGTGTPILLVVSEGVIAYTMFALLIIMTVFNCVLNILSVSKYDKPSLILCVASFVCITLGVLIDNKGSNTPLYILLSAGIGTMLIGNFAFLRVKKKYFHVIWHLFSVITSVLHFLAFYLFAF